MFEGMNYSPQRFGRILTSRIHRVHKDWSTTPLRNSDREKAPGYVPSNSPTPQADSETEAMDLFVRDDPNEDPFPAFMILSGVFQGYSQDSLSLESSDANRVVKG